MGDVSSLAATMQAQQAQLAERILSQLSGSQPASKPATAQHGSRPKPARGQPAALSRPAPRGRAGVGADVSAHKAAGATTMSDPRLKGRLTKRKHSDETDTAAHAARKRHASLPDDEEPSWDELAPRAESQRSKKRDVFDVAASKVPKPVATPGEETLTKAQRKKLRRKQRLSEATADSTYTSVLSLTEPATSSQQATESAEERDSGSAQDVPAEPKDIAHATPAAPAPAAVKRTKLQEQMSASLAGARFRSINETLYTTTTQDALKLMQDEPETMSEYHQGFASQAKKWPVNPVLRIASCLRELSAGSKGKGKGKVQRALTIADLGAGRAPLARELAKDSWATVLSYDLLDSEDGMVIGCDVGTRIPLPGRRGLVSEQVEKVGKDLSAHSAGVVDVAVFCLSLMGTNWVDMLVEARRILKPKGTLLVAEVTSRLVSNQGFIDLILDLGFDMRSADEASKAFFTLVEFTKNENKLVHPEWLNGSDWSQIHAEQRAKHAEHVKRGEALLKPCIYKRR